MLELLTAPTAFEQRRNYRFMVELASIQILILTTTSSSTKGQF